MPHQAIVRISPTAGTRPTRAAHTTPRIPGGAPPHAVSPRARRATLGVTLPLLLAWTASHASAQPLRAGISVTMGDGGFAVVPVGASMDLVAFSSHSVPLTSPNCVTGGTVPGAAALAARSIQPNPGWVFAGPTFGPPTWGVLAAPKTAGRVSATSDCTVAAGDDMHGSAGYVPVPPPTNAIQIAAYGTLAAGSSGSAAAEASDPFGVLPGTYPYAPRITEFEIERSSRPNTTAFVTLFAYDSRSSLPLWVASVWYPCVSDTNPYPCIDARVDQARLPNLNPATIIQSLSANLDVPQPGHVILRAPFDLFATVYAPTSLVNFSAGGQSGILVPPNPCVADVDDGSGSGTPDGGVTIDDLLYYLFIFEAGEIRSDVDDGSSTGTPDGGVTIDDLLYYLFRFEAGC